MIHRREEPWRLGSSPIAPWNLVARMTSSRRPPASALATISSDSPCPYTSAVSPKLIPASSARWMMRIESSWSGLPQAPNIIAPRHSLLTETPVRPSGRCSMGLLLAAGRGGGGVLVVGDLVAPVGGDVVVVDLVEGEVDHEAVGRGAVPVVLVGLEEDTVAGADDLDGAAAPLDAPDALGDVDGLPERVRVPRGPCARGEVDEV